MSTPSPPRAELLRGEGACHPITAAERTVGRIHAIRFPLLKGRSFIEGKDMSSMKELREVERALFKIFGKYQFVFFISIG